jgi:hypothetical protein
MDSQTDPASITRSIAGCVRTGSLNRSLPNPQIAIQISPKGLVSAAFLSEWKSGLQPTLAGAAVHGGFSRSKCCALFALDALGQVFGASLLRNAVALRYVRHTDIPKFMAEGWELLPALNGTHHGEYLALMRRRG